MPRGEARQANGDRIGEGEQRDGSARWWRRRRRRRWRWRWRRPNRCLRRSLARSSSLPFPSHGRNGRGGDPSLCWWATKGKEAAASQRPAGAVYTSPRRPIWINGWDSSRARVALKLLALASARLSDALARGAHLAAGVGSCWVAVSGGGRTVRWGIDGCRVAEDPRPGKSELLRPLGFANPPVEGGAWDAPATAARPCFPRLADYCVHTKKYYSNTSSRCY